MGRTQEALETIDKFHELHGVDETTKNGKLFKTLKNQVQRRIGNDNAKSQELAQKMVNQKEDEHEVKITLNVSPG